MPKTGPRFVSELKAAGLDPALVPIAWSANDGTLLSVLTAPQVAIFNVVLAVHNPYAPTDEQIRLEDFTASTQVNDLLQRLKNASITQIDEWLIANVTNLTQARSVLAAIIKVLVLSMARQV